MINWLKKMFGVQPKVEPVAEQQVPAEDPNPYAVLAYENGSLKVTNYNSAFVNKLRQEFGDLVTDETLDSDVVQLYVDRENLKREEPKLEVIHLGIEEDGKLKIKLEWNRAFILHLNERGITGESEDETIQNYLSMLVSNAEEEFNAFQNPETIDEAFKEIDQEIEKETKEIVDGINKKQRRRRRKTE